MGALSLLVLLLLFARDRALALPGGGSTITPDVPPPTPPPTPRPPPSPAQQAAAERAAATTPPPWPQAIPSGLPSFPSGWQPDEPPGPGVVARATQLLPQLWAHGAGTRKTEQTQGRWITYVATQMGTKRGVVAWRPRPVATPAPMASRPAPAPVIVDVPAVVPASVPAAPAAPSPLALPTLRQGSSGPEVAAMQSRLGIPADGKFGPKTKAAVVAFQRSRGLVADGIVGAKTWAALMA